MAELVRSPQPDAPPERRAITRALLFVAGSLCVGLAVLGVFLPLMPTTIFLILASFCYANSSRRAHRWLLGNRLFGIYLRSYHEHRAIPRRAKILAIAMLWAGITVSGWVIGVLWVDLVLAVVGVGVTLYLVRLKTLSTSSSE